MSGYRDFLFGALLLSLAACGGSGGGSDSGGDPRRNPSVADADGTVTTPQVPAEHWGLNRETAARVDISQAKVDAILDYVLADAATQSVLVSKDGYVIGEGYAAGFDVESYGTSWSVAKSIYSAAMGVAIDEGFFSSVDQKASSVLTEFLGTDKEDITLKQILRMRSGLASNTNVFFSGDQTAHALANTLTSEPGSRYDYSNANSQLFEPLLARATGKDAHTYVLEKILEPIGISAANVGLWLDSTGTQPMTYCCIDMRPDDFLRFGLMFAREGRWEDTQVVPASYVQDSLEPVGFYGYQWWSMNETLLGKPVTADIKSAVGLHGQRVLVWPEQDIVVVVLTQYEHFRNQGYVLDLTEDGLNFPNTCTARNICSTSSGEAVPSYDLHGLVELIADLNAE
jgi:CubicO group peptidase (beta-lactamase class C family)